MRIDLSITNKNGTNIASTCSDFNAKVTVSQTTTGPVIPVWTPTQLGSKLFAWYEPASANVVLDGSNNIISYTDLTGNGNTLSQASAVLRPPFVASGGGGGKGYINNSANVGLATTGGGWLGAQPLYIIGVYNCIGASVNNSYLWDNGNNASIAFRGVSTDTISTFAGSFGPTAPIIVGSVFEVECYFNSASSTIAINGGAPSAPSNTSAAGGTQFTLGSYFGVSGGNGFNGQIGPVLVCNDVLTSGERASLHTYLQAWGVP